jgi:hypothetical protein
MIGTSDIDGGLLGKSPEVNDGFYSKPWVCLIGDIFALPMEKYTISGIQRRTNIWAVGLKPFQPYSPVA